MPDSECVFAVVLTRGNVRHMAQDWNLSDDELETVMQRLDDAFVYGACDRVVSDIVNELMEEKRVKTGFIENVYANQIAFGRLYREKLKEQVEALGYETEVVGKHGMWEMPGVPVEAFSGRSQTIFGRKRMIRQRQNTA